jgi:hypothetical protein
VRSFHRRQRTNDAIAHYKTLPQDRSPQHPVFEKHAAKLVGEVDHSVSAHLGEPYRPKPGPCFSGEQHHGIMPDGRLLDFDVSI